MIPGEAASLGSLDAVNSGNWLRDLSLKFSSDLFLKFIEHGTFGEGSHIQPIRSEKKCFLVFDWL